MQKPTVTIEDRIEVTDEFKEYYDEFIPFVERIKRWVWKRITVDGIRQNGILVKMVMAEFGVSKRTANSAVREIKGRFASLKELTREQIKTKKRRAGKLKKRIERNKKKLKRFDKILSKRPIPKAEHAEFLNTKSRIYYDQNRLNKLLQKISQMEEAVRTGKLKLCFGSRKDFKAQYYLKENSFKNHNQWLRAFRAGRDKNAFYVGSKEETGANQQFSVSYDSESDSFSFRIRKEYRFMKNENDKYFYLKGIHFNHLRDNFREVAVNSLKGEGDFPLTYRIKKRGRKYYLQAIFGLERVNETPGIEIPGAVGLDFNVGFIALSEINGDGNLVGTERININGVSSGERKDSLFKVIKKISLKAKEAGKPVVAENLSFSGKKAKMIKARSKKGKEYNRMISSFEYSRYKQALTSRCYKDGVKLKFVDPRNTTKIGEQKYAGKRSLNSHQSAAFVIARRGMGFKDKLQKQVG